MSNRYRLRPRDLLPGSPFPTTAAWEASRSGYDYPVLPPYTAEDMQRPVERFDERPKTL